MESNSKTHFVRIIWNGLVVILRSYQTPASELFEDAIEELKYAYFKQKEDWDD